MYILTISSASSSGMLNGMHYQLKSTPAKLEQMESKSRLNSAANQVHAGTDIIIHVPCSPHT